MKGPIKVSKLAIVYSPPTLIVEYVREHHSSGESDLCDDNGDFLTTPRSLNNANDEKKYYHRKIEFKAQHLRNTETNPDNVARELQDHFPMLLGEHQINLDKVVDLLRKLITTVRVQQQSNSKEVSLQSNTAVSSMSKCTNYDIDGDHRINEHNKMAANYIASPHTSNGVHEHVMLNAIESLGDLNKVSEQQLLLAKEKMNVVFDSNRILPGEEGYQYDKRVDYDAISDSSWDSAK